MAKGYSIIIGLNKVNPEHYAGWDGELDQPVNDAHAISELAKAANFETKLFLDDKATREGIISEIQNASQTLESGDVCFIYYSGHGGQVDDLSWDEEDELDETWCLYDAQLIDDEIHYLLTEFKPGVRIVVLSDSCHSGTITKALPWEDKEVVEKMMPHEYIQKTFDKNKDLYTEIYDELRKLNADDIEIQASVLQISGCQDYETSLAFRKDAYSLFTKMLLESQKEKSLNYQQLHESITRLIDERLKFIGRRQTPNLFLLGKENPEFVQEPFLKI